MTAHDRVKARLAGRKLDISGLLRDDLTELCADYEELLRVASAALGRRYEHFKKEIEDADNHDVRNPRA